MYTLKAFATNNSLISTINNDISPVGQLSKQSLTFSRNITEYVNEPSPGLAVLAFTSVDDVKGNIAVPSDILPTVLAVQQFVYTRQPTVAGDTPQTLLQALQAQFGTNLSNLATYDMVAAESGILYPDFLTFVVTNSTTTNQIQLYFSDPYFSTHYDSYEIVVVPPIVPIDTFLGTPVNVKAAIANIKYDDTLNRITIARGQNPETLLTALDFNYTVPTNNKDLTNTSWSLLLYGPMANDSDLMALAIQQYIAANTQGTLAQWEAIFPDIYNSTQFTFFPKWNSVAIPNMNTIAGIYSNNGNLSTDLAALTALVPSYDVGFVSGHGFYMPFPYKSLDLLHIGSPKNRNNIYDINQLFPDIINVASTDNDFNRMSANTQKFLSLLYGAIVLAETANQFTGLKIPYIKLTRNGNLYISFSYNNFQFLVLAKSSVVPPVSLTQ
jgi:hypothetical protein